MRRQRKVSLRPPERRRGEEWDMWCYEMRVVRGYALCYIAAVANVTAASVEAAVTRVESGRYGK